jgi:hypothetical protein
MAFKQYTRCIEPSEFTDLNHLLVATIQGLLVGATASAVALAKSAKPHCWWLVAEVFAVAWVLAYCRLFLYHRLLCLGGDQDAIGVVVSVDGSSLRGFPDNDFNVNLLLENNQFGDKRATVEVSSPYGFLVHEQDKIRLAGLPHGGHESDDEATGTTSETLHCEFEGGGAYALLVGAEVAFAAASAALILCVYLPPIPYLSTVITVLAILALLALALGALIGLGTSGSPSDVNPNLGEIHDNDDANGGMGSGADILYINGTWVFDPWHQGYNELHPVKVCTKIGTWEGGWDSVPPDVILRVRGRFQEAASEITQLAQQRRENQWTVHPSLDSCSADIIT